MAGVPDDFKPEGPTPRPRVYRPKPGPGKYEKYGTHAGARDSGHLAPPDGTFGRGFDSMHAEDKHMGRILDTLLRDKDANKHSRNLVQERERAERAKNLAKHREHLKELQRQKEEEWGSIADRLREGAPESASAADKADKPFQSDPDPSFWEGKGGEPYQQDELGNKYFKQKDGSWRNLDTGNTMDEENQADAETDRQIRERKQQHEQNKHDPAWWEQLDRNRDENDHQRAWDSNHDSFGDDSSDPRGRVIHDGNKDDWQGRKSGPNQKDKTFPEDIPDIPFYAPDPDTPRDRAAKRHWDGRDDEPEPFTHEWYRPVDESGPQHYGSSKGPYKPPPAQPDLKRTPIPPVPGFTRGTGIKGAPPLTRIPAPPKPKHKGPDKPYSGTPPLRRTGLSTYRGQVP